MRRDIRTTRSSPKAIPNPFKIGSTSTPLKYIYLKMIGFIAKDSKNVTTKATTKAIRDKRIFSKR